MKRVVSMLALLVLSTPSVAKTPDPDPSIAAFSELKRDVEVLRKDPQRRQFRHNYEKLVVRLQAEANTHAQGSRADDAAFVAAQLLEELYYVSRMPADKDAAVAAFVACADRFSTSNLADDALLAASRLTTAKAARADLLGRIVRLKGADLKATAEAELKQLERVLDPPALSAPAADALKKLAPAPVVAEARVEERLSAVDVLPEAPPSGTPSRKVIVITHEVGADSAVVLRMSGEVGVTRGEVPKQDGGPRRIFFDLAPAKLGQRNIQPIEVNDGVVTRVRAGQYDASVVRLVVELAGAQEPVLSVKRAPFEVRLTSPAPRVDVDAVTGQPLLARALPTETDTAPVADEVKARFENGVPGGVSISQQLGLKVHRVVVDAGHGGSDTGAIGPSGVREKDITLQIAKRVKEKLAAELPGVEVIMTRDDDRTLALQDRTNTANSSAADLFISIHCNASPQKRVRGMEIYTLNITHDRYAMKLAARENAETGEGSISDLDYILADLAMKSNVDDSVRLGRQVQKGVMGNVHKRWPDVPDLGLKHALFYVLMGNRMPSILVETSFLSNKVEEQRLASVAYQDSIASGVVDGVRLFVEERQAFYEQRP